MAKTVKNKRACGVLMPIFSLPSKYGIGSFSKEAYDFVDFLEKSGQSYWQLLPLGPTSYGDSPYQSFSTYAGNPYFVDLEKLIDMGLLKKEEVDKVNFGGDESHIDYARLFKTRYEVLYKAYVNSGLSPVSTKAPEPELKKEFDAFVKDNEDWLPDFALYMSLKKRYDGLSWVEWPEDLRLRKEDALKAAREKHADRIGLHEFIQFLFMKQWFELKAYANKKGIDIIGDIPIYVAFDSADTWANPKLFQLDKKNMPIAVAGCPPDSFSRTGQLWGNPLYDWEYHEKTGFKWWMNRIKGCYKLYDVVRIDHFRGFDEYYSIPFGEPTAENGHWVKGPGYKLFEVMKKELGDLRVIAEDLGYLTPSVIKLVKRTGFPGMKILQFAFDPREESDYLPHNYIQNSIVYTGTHDNETTLGWLDAIPRADKRFAKKYLNIKSNKGIVWEFIRACFSSVSDTAIIPMQDYLELGTEARINTPSTLGNNWVWRMKGDACTDELAERMLDMAKTYGRNANV
ncbi:4-alpha-glucanotransferase [Butyrivibrio sp. AE3004]|uniref:4-alpha-glucanotransferase n=1 Tax=Butyrivibrio sp. AE3004 TaxID=1506994 RepID=UPI0004941B62|nr:4-alpha-glucanotransferase [Butyrivibrio sp. AE3004]